MKRSQLLFTAISLLLMAALVIASEGAVHGASAALHTCAVTIVPCLFPFFVISFLINRSGLPQWLGLHLKAPMSLLFGVSGTGAGVFLLGIMGGYPAGASVIADLVRQGHLQRTEAERLLMFCNNSGPAFLIGAIGIGIFRSSAAGLLLYGVHILAAVITGLFLAGSRNPDSGTETVVIESLSLTDALPDAIGKAVTQILQVCGYVVFFGAAVGTMEALGLFSAVYGTIALHTPMTLMQARSLCMGIMELGCGIGAMEGAALTASNLTLCSFLVGCGGLSVGMQTLGMLQGTGIRLRCHIIGRLCCGSIAAFIMYTISSLLLL